MANTTDTSNSNFLRKIAVGIGLFLFIVLILFAVVMGLLFSLEIGLYILAATLLTAIPLYFLLYRRTANRERILREGISADAIITDIKDTGWQGGDAGAGQQTPIMKYFFRVTLPTGELYDTFIRDLFSNPLLAAFKTGKSIKVRVDPKKRSKIIIESVDGVPFNDIDKEWGDVADTMSNI